MSKDQFFDSHYATDSERGFIDDLAPDLLGSPTTRTRREMLVNYWFSLRRRKVWGKIDRAKTFQHLIRALAKEG
uniref:Uncharacterized protein n=1 Tax=viral metagenome TaxID=1070528 RepID=A0A6M3Y7A6_9ZZZZ